MHELSFFIGSSCERNAHRGDLRRELSRLNDKYEPYGLRIRILCWEQFAPEYVGESKQKEYDESLVKKCDWAIFVFANKAGNCTLHELSIAKEYGRSIKSFFLPVKENKYKKAVEAILRNHAVVYEKVASIFDVVAFCSTVVDDYASRYGIQVGSLKRIEGSKGIFVTLGGSVPFKKDNVEDVIRDLDSILENSILIRCHLMPWNDVAEIKNSDVYVGLFYNNNVNQDEEEFREATKQLNHSLLRCIVPFQYVDKSRRLADGAPTRIIDVKDSDISKYLVNRECYTISCSSLDRVSFVLFKVLYRNKSSEITVQDRNFEFKADGVYYGKKYLGGYDSVDLDTNSKVLINTIEKQYEVIRTNRKTLSDTEYDSMLLDYSQNCIRLGQSVCVALNKITETWPADSSETRIRLEARLVELAQGLRTDTNLFHTTILEYTEVLESDYNSSAISASSYIEKLMLAIGYYDSYLPSNTEDEEPLFKTINDVAEHNAISTPEVEMMRMNYANTLSSKQQVGDSLPLYKGALMRLKSFDKALSILSYYKARLLTNYLHSAIEVGKESELVQELLTELSNTVVESETEKVLLRCLYFGCKLRSLPVSVMDDDVIKQAEQAYEDAADNVLDIREECFDDVFCSLPNAIAAYHIDRLEYVQDKIVRDAYSRKSLRYINSELSFLKAKAKRGGSQEVSYSFYEASALHNLGFLYALLGRIGDSVESYRQALAIRRQLFHYSQQADLECLEAETLVNLVGIILPNLDMFEERGYQLLLDDARKALAIYERCFEVGNEQSELNVYKAKQLLGTVLFVFWQRGLDGGDRERGVDLMKEAYLWSQQHPGNDYECNFDNNSGRVLKALRIV